MITASKVLSINDVISFRVYPDPDHFKQGVRLLHWVVRLL